MPDQQIETGTRVLQSPTTGIVYRVTKWIDKGDGKYVAVEKEPLPDELQYDDIIEL
jgi:hypothetical protein